jgi:predicted permease
LILGASLVIVSTIAGYLARRKKVLGESSAKWIMTAVMVAGYPTINLLAIWGRDLVVSDLWLPTLGAVNITIMAFVGIAMGKLITRDPVRRGLTAVHTGITNTGITMGGLVLLSLYGKEGLEVMGLYCLTYMPVIALVMYPIARHFSPSHAGGPLWRLLLRSIFDWRSIGVPMAILGLTLSLTNPMAILGLTLSLTNVPQPKLVDRLYLVEIAAYGTVIAAYFSIGLRLHFSHTRQLLPLIGALAVGRFVISAAVGLGLYALTQLTPWPLTGVAGNALIIEAVAPTAVAAVAVANMFDLRPHESSTLFVINTAMFVLLVWPVVFLIFS